MKIKLFIEI
ncbi:UNVERIFIED_CONTAM: hypothetical protein GTU68_058611 [Idotea baltica]|nr:hypothetical protein [Idotea baltica]